MAEACELERPFRGHVEVDESYFGAARVKGKAGRGDPEGRPSCSASASGTARSTPRSSRIARNPRFWPRFGGKSTSRSVIHSDGFKSYDGLVDMGYQKHLRVDHSANEFSSRKCGNHINGIEGFWGYAKTRLARFKASPEHLLPAPEGV